MRQKKKCEDCKFWNPYTGWCSHKAKGRHYFQKCRSFESKKSIEELADEIRLAALRLKKRLERYKEDHK